MGRPLSYPLPFWVLCPAVLLSGAAALVYEIVWARRLTLVVGSTTAAAAAVLSAFMFGLALGALLVGRQADASRRPLRWYGILEVGIGIYALAFESLLDFVTGWLPGQPWLAAFALLVLPAALMGGTLPVLARAGADTIQRGTRAFGSLYGINTLGAVLGALLAAFVLLESLGLRGATTVVAAVNIGLGVLFWVLGTVIAPREVYAGDERPAATRWTGDAGIAVVAAFFVAGFAALALELAWFRLLVYFLEGFTIAFGLMLAAYLLGLGTGALGGTWLSQIVGNPRRLLSRILLVEAVLAVATFLLLNGIGDGLETMRAEYTTARGIDAAYGWALFWAALAVVFPATFCAGMLMPVVSRIALSDREAIGSQTGVVYAASTFGAVLAPPVAAFLLLPGLGASGTIVAMGVLLLIAGTALALTRDLTEWIFAGGAAVVFVVVCFAGDLGTPLIQRSHVFRPGEKHRRLLAHESGALGDVAVVEELRNGTRRLYIDGFSAAETSPQYGYMRMQGHLPVLLHPNPEKVLVIAYGTGTTAGAVSVHPEVKEIVCVEIEPAVYAVSSWFAKQNRDVLKQKRTTAVVADGREFLGRGGAYDVITLEPLMPYTPAAVTFYTQEFYEIARRSLRPGGILCQWIPPQGVSGADFKRLVASVAAAFDHVSLWYFRHAVLVLGSDRAPRIDGKRFVKRCTRPEIYRDLQLAAVGDPVHLLGAHVCSGEVLKEALGGVAPMVDDKTDLEFRPLVRGLGKRSATYHAEVLEFLRDHHQDQVPWLAGTLPEIETALRSGGTLLATLAREQRYRVRGEDEDVPPAYSTDLDRLLEIDPKALFARMVQQRRRYVELMGRGAAAEAAQLTYAPDRSLAYLALADRAEGEQRFYYLTLAVGQNALLNPRQPEKSARLLRELAQRLAGPERRFCLNRARHLAGEAMEPGEETVPKVKLPDLRAALEAEDEEGASAALEAARQADAGDLVERQAWEWFKAAKDRRAAFRLLYAIGSSQVLRAASRLVRSGRPEDLVAVAGYYCERFPTPRTWADLCQSSFAEVRVAAADAAKSYGTRAHLGNLARLAADADYQVRLSAIVSFRDIDPRAEKVGYDPKRPTEDALAALAKIAGRPAGGAVSRKVGSDTGGDEPGADR